MNMGNQTVDGPQYCGSQRLPSTIWSPSFFEISHVQKKNETHTGLEQLKGE